VENVFTLIDEEPQQMAAAYEEQLFSYAMDGCPWRYTPATCAATNRACERETCAVWHGLKELMRCAHPCQK
jgi:hypothetical protein